MGYTGPDFHECRSSSPIGMRAVSSSLQPSHKLARVIECRGHTSCGLLEFAFFL